MNYNIYTKKQKVYKNLLFFVILFFLITQIYSLVRKNSVVFPSLRTDNMNYLTIINEYDKVLKKQEEYAEKMKSRNEEIESMDFGIFQAQKQDNLRNDILKMKNISIDNHLDAKFLFGIQSSDVLKVYFDSREELSSLKRNIEKIDKNLQECKANI